MQRGPVILFAALGVVIGAGVTHIRNEWEKSKLRKLIKDLIDDLNESNNEAHKAHDSSVTKDWTILTQCLESIQNYITYVTNTGKVKDPNRFILLSAILQCVLEMQKNLKSNGLLSEEEKIKLTIINSFINGATEIKDHKDFFEDLVIIYRKEAMSSLDSFISNVLKCKEEELIELNVRLFQLKEQFHSIEVNITLENTGFDEKENITSTIKELEQKIIEIKDKIDNISFLQIIARILFKSNENDEADKALKIVLKLAGGEILTISDKKFIYAFKLKYANQYQ